MKILLVQSGFLGDVVLSTPVIAELRSRYPGVHIALLTTLEGSNLVAGDSHLDEVIVFDKRGKDRGFAGLLRIAKLLRKKRFSKVFSLHKSYRTAFLLFLAGIPVRYGFSEASASWLYHKTVRRGDLPHEVLRNLAILRVIGVEPEGVDRPLRLELPVEAQKNADKLLEEFASDDFVAIAPGSVWATKRWTEDGYAQTVDQLSRDGLKVVLLGGPKDLEVGASIERKSQSALINLIGKCDLITSAAIISRAKLLITNDSAPLHIASACATPVVSIFCATVPEFGFGPWMVPSRVVEVKDLSCRPCGRHGGQSCPTGTHACQLQILASDVMSAIRSLLDELHEKTAYVAEHGN